MKIQSLAHPVNDHTEPTDPVIRSQSVTSITSTSVDVTDTELIVGQDSQVHICDLHTLETLAIYPVKGPVAGISTDGFNGFACCTSNEVSVVQSQNSSKARIASSASLDDLSGSTGGKSRSKSKRSKSGHSPVEVSSSSVSELPSTMASRQSTFSSTVSLPPALFKAGLQTNWDRITGHHILTLKECIFVGDYTGIITSFDYNYEKLYRVNLVSITNIRTHQSKPSILRFTLIRNGSWNTCSLLLVTRSIS
jgi:hypothetical protein